MIPVEAVEAAAKAINESHAFRWASLPWDQLVESKDNANQNRVRLDRAYASAALEAAAPYIKAEALRDAADAIDAQRDATNPSRKPDEAWSVIDHREGRFLGKTVAARLLRTIAAEIEGDEGK